jgi:hypothetical protein
MATSLLFCFYSPCSTLYSSLDLREHGSPNRFGEPLPRTTLRCGRNGLNGQCHQVLLGLSVFQAYDACYFVTQVPKKVVL